MEWHNPADDLMRIRLFSSITALTVAAALLSFLCVGALTIASLRAPAAATFAHAPWIRAGAAAVIGAAFALATSLAFRSAELSPIARSVAHSRQVTEAWMAVYVLDSDLFRFMVDEVTSAWDASLAVAIAACAAVLLVATQLILMFDAQRDECMPQHARDDFWETLGRPERISFHYGHKKSFLAMTPLGFNYMRRQIYRFLEATL